MSTITTKQLRENMPQVIRDLQMGKPVKLSYRHKVVGILQPVQSMAAPLRRGSAQAVRKFLQSANFSPIPQQLQNSDHSFKKQIAALRSRDLAS